MLLLLPWLLHEIMCMLLRLLLQLPHDVIAEVSVHSGMFEQWNLLYATWSWEASYETGAP